MNSYGTSEVAYIDLNIKIVDCRRKFNYGATPYGEYNDVRSIVRNDMNEWFAPMFSTYFYRDSYTRLCTNTQIRINNFTFK